MNVYSLCLLGALIGSSIFWARTTRNDDKLFVIYLSAIAFGFVGAAILYLLCEGNLNAPIREVVAGKSVIGGLLGGFLGVELSKRLMKYQRATGDKFAAILTLGIALGRVGCIFAECCPGVPISASSFAMADSHGVYRWPAPLVEIFFNLAMASVFFYWRRIGMLITQHFHIYLISYGIFRVVHEQFRDTGAARFGYQSGAIVLIIAGLTGYHLRKQRLLTNF